MPLLASPKVFNGLVKKGEVESLGPPSIDWLGVPLKISDSIIGVLAVQSYTKGLRYSQEDMKILTFISEQVVMTIDRMKSHESIIESEALFRSVVENSHDGISILDDKFRIEYVNERVIPIIGYSPKEMVGKDFRKFIDPDDLKLVVDFYTRRQKGEDVPPRYEINLKHKDGGTRHVEVSSSVIKDKDGRMRTVAQIKDITDRKIADDKIKTSLKEKEMLLKEVHHRVKNNMQIVSSLLNLQSKHIEDPSTHDIFREGQNRVRSMALVHEKLYQSEDLARVDFFEYIQSLSNYLFQVYGIKASDVQMEIDVKDFFLDINTAIPCGLIVNEIITNSLKHAFPKGKKGEIKVRIEPVDPTSFYLNISDNGIGLPPELNVQTTQTLGLQLVNMLVEQLSGEYEVQSKAGTDYKIRVQRQEYKTEDS
jgi:PAS domain S-box-containing protein